MIQRKLHRNFLLLSICQMPSEQPQPTSRLQNENAPIREKGRYGKTQLHSDVEAAKCQRTHFVYHKQGKTGEPVCHLSPVSYTHLDVYKRQGESRRAPWRSVPLKKLNFQFHIKFEFAVKAKAAESLVPSNDSAAFLFAAFSMQHRQTAFLSKRLFYLCRQEQSKVEQHDRCCDCSHDQ